MAVINKLSISCSGGAPTVFTIGLLDTNDSGINAILAAIPSSFGTYTYSHSVSGGLVSSALNANEASGCQATLFKDGVGYSTSGTCCASIEPADLLSADAGQVLTIGLDGKIYYNGAGAVVVPRTDVFSPTSGNTLMLSFTPLTTRHVQVFRNGTREMEGVEFTRAGTVLTYPIDFGMSGGGTSSETIIIDYFSL